VANKKTLVIEVLGIGKMHISAKNGANIRKFAIEIVETKLNWVESQVKSSLVPIFVKSFFSNIGMPCLVFFLGSTSHIMTPCGCFTFF
jgi:hypothetical protein